MDTVYVLLNAAGVVSRLMKQMIYVSVMTHFCFTDTVEVYASSNCQCASITSSADTLWLHVPLQPVAQGQAGYDLDICPLS